MDELTKVALLAHYTTRIREAIGSDFLPVIEATVDAAVNVGFTRAEVYRAAADAYRAVADHLEATPR